MSEVGSIIEYNESLADAEAPKSLPGGDYPMSITATEIVTSQSSGKLNVKVTWRIKPEDFPPDYEDADAYADGKSVVSYVGAEPDKASRYRMRQFCEAIGIKLAKKLDVNEWIGKDAVGTIVPEEYEGVERERVTRVSAL